MAQDEFDNGNGMLANQQENIVQAQSGEGQADSQGGEASRGGQTQSGEGSPQPSQAADNQQTPPGLLGRLSEERRAKLAALLAGTSGFDPKMPSFSAMPKGVAGYEGKKEEPLIGPDGGMVGRGIKSVGDAYQEYINGQRDTIMNTMNHELGKLIPYQIQEGVAAWAHGATRGKTGMDTDFEPKYFSSYLVSPSLAFKLLPNTNLLSAGLKQRVNPIVPVAVQAMRAIGGEEISNTEAFRTGKALWGGSSAISMGPEIPNGQQGMKSAGTALIPGYGEGGAK